MSIDRTGTLQLGPDLALSYAEQGDPDGPVFVLIPWLQRLLAVLRPAHERAARQLQDRCPDAARSRRQLEGARRLWHQGIRHRRHLAMEKLGIIEAAIVGHSPAASLQNGSRSRSRAACRVSS